MRLLILIGLTILSSQTWALGKLGHSLVCELAYQHLSPTTQTQVDKLLAQLPAAERKSLNQYARAEENSKITFAKACLWADAIKKQDKYKQFKSWHYVNIDRDKPHFSANLCKQNCVTRAIDIHQKQLANKHNSTRSRLEALMFLGHWLGDIHQPMHVSFASDWGGNKVKVNSNDDRCTNMHWLWDECLLTRNKLSYQQRLAQLQTIWQQAPIAKWQHSQPAQWADESLQIVRSPEAKYCQLNGNTCMEKPSAVITAAYQKHFQAVLAQRMVQASARLVSLLEKSL